MMSTEIVAEERAEHILRQAVTATCAAAHSVLALAAATGLSANLDTLDARESCYPPRRDLPQIAD
jgi:hypothetical protein